MDKIDFFVLCILSTAFCDEVCIPGNDTTCPTGHCCLKHSPSAYTPLYPGLKPSFEISCVPFRQRGEFCYPFQNREICLCDSSLICATNGGWYGHCV
ncbi:hypothetical protein DPMN_162885 [Dreissena polymorpha]|uniref:Prokineticin domain-containing protein n=1 Tax=Dreissena polymorpha TaxID=45954 RepID=A0A9D4ES99_DREPO|nr:hypothetical protein DPMN_162885 [Dreissena polymorpha]